MNVPFNNLQAPQAQIPVQGNVRLLRPKNNANFVPAQRHQASKANIAFAFSGGGIRSAAQCAGVINAVTNNPLVPHDNVKIVSCVSGGGYLGSALVHHQTFKPFPENSPHFDWNSFFKHFRENHGCIFFALHCMMEALLANELCT